MEIKPKFKVGDKVYVKDIIGNDITFSREIISCIQISCTVWDNETQTKFMYCVEGIGNMYNEDFVTGATEHNVYNAINEHYDNKIKTIEEERQKSIDTFKDR